MEVTNTSIDQENIEGNGRVRRIYLGSYDTNIVCNIWNNYRCIFFNNEERVTIINFQQRHVGEQRRNQLAGNFIT